MGRFLFSILWGIKHEKRYDQKGDHQAPARSLLHATGALKQPTDMNKPFVAICNSYIDIVPGHVHLRELGDIAKEAIKKQVRFLSNLTQLVLMMVLPWDTLA